MVDRDFWDAAGSDVRIKELFGHEYSEMFRYPVAYKTITDRYLQQMTEEAIARYISTGQTQAIDVGIVGAGYGQEIVSFAVMCERLIKKIIAGRGVPGQAVQLRIHVLSKGGVVFDKVKNNQITYPASHIQSAFVSQDERELYFAPVAGGFRRSNHLNNLLSFYDVDLADSRTFANIPALSICLLHNVLQYVKPNQGEDQAITAAFDYLEGLLKTNGVFSVANEGDPWDSRVIKEFDARLRNPANYTAYLAHDAEIFAKEEKVESTNPSAAGVPAAAPASWSRAETEVSGEIRTDAQAALKEQKEGAAVYFEGKPETRFSLQPEEIRDLRKQLQEQISKGQITADIPGLGQVTFNLHSKTINGKTAQFLVANTLSQGEIGAHIQQALDRLGLEGLDTSLPYLILPANHIIGEDGQDHLAGDCVKNGVIFLHKNLPEVMNKLAPNNRQALLQVLLGHELEHEITGEKGSVAERRFSLQDAQRLAELAGDGVGEFVNQPFLMEEFRDALRYRLSGINFERTLPKPTSENEFLAKTAEDTKKSIEEIRKDLDARAEKFHLKMQREYGFLERGHSPQIRAIYQLFDRLVPVYNQLAQNQGGPSFRGKLFIVDTADPNALVYAGHDDVYLNMGLLREAARYFKEDFSEGIIAAILFHELAHILQGSSYEGLSFAKWQEDGLKIQEVLTLKRNAEYDADKKACALLSLAGYSARHLPAVLKFAIAITPSSTTEVTVEDHPHPKQRLAHINLHLTSEYTVTRNWDKDSPGLGYEEYVKLKTDHITDFSQRPATLQQITAELERTTDVKQVLELARLTRERYIHATVRQAADSNRGRSLFAKNVFAENILDVADAIISSHLGANFLETPWCQQQVARFLKDEELKEFSNSPPSQIGEYILETVGQEEFARISGLEEIANQDLLPEQAEIEKTFRKKILMRMRLVHNAAISVEAKAKAMRDIQRLYGYYQSHASEIEENSFIHSEEVSPQETQRIALAYQAGDAQVLKALQRIAFSVYRHFGKSTLDTTIPLASGKLQLQQGPRLPDIDMGTAILEKEDAGLYRKNLQLRPVKSPAERKRAYDIARCSWANSLKNGIRWNGNSGTHRELLLLEDMPVELWGNLTQRMLVVLPDIPIDAALENYDEVNRAVKELIANYFYSGRQMRKQTQQRNIPLPAIQQYIVDSLLPEAEDVRSPIYERENGLDQLPVLRVSIYDFINDRNTMSIPAMKKYHEIEDAPYVPARELADIFSARKSSPSDLAIGFAESLKSYSRPFKKSILSKFVTDISHNSYYFIPGRVFFDIFVQEVGFADAYELMMQYLGNFDGIPKEVNDEESTKKHIAFLEWFFSKHDPRSSMIPTAIGYQYITAQCRLMDLQGQVPNPDILFRHLEYLSRVSPLHIKTVGEFEQTQDREDFILGIVKRDTPDRQLREDELPIGLLGKPASKTEQIYCRQLMGLSLTQLQVLARNQNQLFEQASNSPREKKGRARVDLGSMPFLNILNAVITYRIMETLNPETPRLTPDKFDTICSGSITTFERRKNSWSEEVTKEKHFVWTVISYQQLGQKARVLINGFERIKQFLRLLSAGFCPWNNYYSSGFGRDYSIRYDENITDTFLAIISQGFDLKELFPIFAPLMGEIQIPRPRAEALKAEPTRRSYLEAFGRRVEFFGKKADSFCAFAKETGLFSDIRARLFSPEAIQAQKQAVVSLLSLHTLYRDAFIDFMERELFPEIHKHSNVQYDFLDAEHLAWSLRRSVLEIPLEWENLQGFDWQKIPGERQKQLIEFYRAFIPLIADPQRKARFGATAMSLWRAHSGQVSFQEELDAILAFFPEASGTRDEQLDILFSRHELPSAAVPPELMRTAQRLYSVLQNLKYDAELTNTNALMQAIEGAFASASRQDRRDLILWLLNKEKYPVPRPLAAIDKQYNVDFNALPDHSRFMPAAIRREILNNLLTGENGILNVRTEADRALRKEFASALFEHYFPLEENKPQDTGLTNE
ncbi:MAG: hypothetical protein NT033_07540, partial [Candidatus Omnitrophica bacterium]|nr:hypothetical protein [Candidatus Omnitrophota bacterium]